MVPVGQILADAVAVLAIVGLVWRASWLLSKIRFEVSALREDVDHMVTDKERQHTAQSDRIEHAEKRLARLERWRASMRGR